MELGNTYNQILAAGTVALATLALSGCLYENDDVTACGSNATSVEATFTPNQPYYVRAHDPSVLEPLLRDQASAESTIVDHVSVGRGELVCSKGVRQVLTKKALSLARSVERAD